MPTATEPTYVPGFEHRPGNHCGSTALRNLLSFHGLDYSEELVFGLGAGPSFFYLAFDELSPTRFTNGRAGRLEETFLELTGAPLRLETDLEPGRSWELARELVDEGRPSLLLTDLYYLDHYGSSAHFPGHAVVLAGYDAERAYLSDTAFTELQVTRISSLEEARHSKLPMYPHSGHMAYLPAGAQLSDLRGAIPAAVERAAREMLEPPMGEFQGMPALERFAGEVGSWPELATDWQWCARFGFQVIERRGTGGGNFRRMYARFLEEAGYDAEAPLAAAAAERWTDLATAFHAASESETPDPALWATIADAAAQARDAELHLWTTLDALSA